MIKSLHGIFQNIADTIMRTINFLGGFFKTFLESPFALITPIIGLILGCILFIVGVILSAKNKGSSWWICIVFAVLVTVLNCGLIIFKLWV